MAGLPRLALHLSRLGPPRASRARAALHEAAPQRDVLLFEHKRGRFFAFLGFFCAGQGVFWTSLAAAALAGPGGGAQGPEAEGGVPGSGRRPSPSSTLWRYGLAAGCASVGLLVLAAGLLYSRRSVSSVLLRKGGQRVTLTTHAPFGLGAQLTVPLHQVSCMAHRGEVPAVLPIKVKGHRFYFLLDKAGHFPNMRLFDLTVGAYRGL
ncbi:transmembrane protein 223 [Sarcophilus harrisii]|uniref:Transmembrane protein 223 n=1 Tax=Sarcophilus harrisii TaxID=9305 RepID=A0A7N4P167_SARHA|nr:transmembrane protein 223 [Sarcophilus harrisii]